MQQAELLAARLAEEAGEDPATQIQRAYTLLLNREATPDELESCLAFENEHGLAALCRVWLNTNEFLFVE